VSSGITFSGFNSIDFGLILNAIMQAESEPLTKLQSKQTSLKSQANNFATLSSRITNLQNAAAALSTPSDATPFKATSSDSTAVSISAGSSSVAGRYDISVTDLARAQVTASANAAPDATTTTVATGGSITIGSETITVSSSMTLKQLSDAINANADAPARAAVVQSGTNAYKLVLTGKNTGADNAFTVTDNLTGGAFDLEFTDFDDDGVTGDDVEDNAVQAKNAVLTVNNVAITSATNTLDSAIPGATITLLKEDTGTVVADVSADSSALKTKLQSVVTAYNDLMKFVNDQGASAAQGNQASIGRDAMLRGIKGALRGVLSDEYDTGGPFTFLAQIGLEMTTSGTMQLKESKFNDAVKNGTADVALLLGGTDGDGAFAAIEDLLKDYTKSGGFVQSAQTQINNQVTRLATQVENMQSRLAVRRAALQKEFTAADAAMSQLKSQSGSLSNLQPI
jgi:flagellar hook-associated protein 2